MLPAGVYVKKSQQEELDKIMKNYENKKIGNIKETRLMQPIENSYMS